MGGSLGEHQHGNTALQTNHAIMFTTSIGTFALLCWAMALEFVGLRNWVRLMSC